MKPYYDHAGITIYHGDAREMLPDLAPLVPDPRLERMNGTSCGGITQTSTPRPRMTRPAPAIPSAILAVTGTSSRCRWWDCGRLSSPKSRSYESSDMRNYVV